MEWIWSNDGRLTATNKGLELSEETHYHYSSIRLEFHMDCLKPTVTLGIAELQEVDASLHEAWRPPARWFINLMQDR